MITSFIEVLHLPNFGHVQLILITWYNFAGDAMDRNYDVKIYLKIYLFEEDLG